MKKMNKNILCIFLIILLSVSFAGCSEELSEELEIKEIIKPQLDALKKAKEVEGLLQDAAERREQQLQEQEY